LPRSNCLNPRYQPAYDNLGGVVELVPPGNGEDRRFLELGKKLYPDDGMIRLGLAVIARREGDEAGSRSLLDGVLTAYCYVEDVAHIELNGHILVPLQNIASLHCSSRCDAQANEDWPPRGLLDDDGPNGSRPDPDDT